jgi:hypothetical protein
MRALVNGTKYQAARHYFTDLHESAERIARNHQRLAAMAYLAGIAELNIHPVREHYLVYVPISKISIVIVAFIRQTRDVPAILKANGFMIKRQLKEVFEKLEQGTIPNLAR